MIVSKQGMTYLVANDQNGLRKFDGHKSVIIGRSGEHLIRLEHGL